MKPFINNKRTIMKRQLLLVFTFSTLFGYSQIPIANYESNQGSIFEIATSATAAVDNSPAGANAVWNFTGLVKESETVDSYASPTAQELIDYPNTTYVFTATRNGVPGKIFSEDNSGAISITGVEGEGLVLNYNNAAQGGNALIGNFPLSYGATATTDDVAGDFTYVPFNIMGTFTGTITTEVDAFGTLTVTGTNITPFTGSVTRLKIIQDLNMSVANGNINQTTYNYYDDNTEQLIFRTSTLAITSSLVNDTSILTERLKETTFGVLDKNTANASLKVFPNPVKNTLQLDLTEFSNIQRITAYDVTGREVICIKSHTHTIDVSSLRPGLYVIHVMSDRGMASSKFIKK